MKYRFCLKYKKPKFNINHKISYLIYFNFKLYIVSKSKYFAI
ncbi:MAG: hypothetical protein BAJALOKI3v1_380016 [Promethearchaeota archaeon]|nr:MAG: hypothetical protein BAJALOKI3v1_380016 [Candidatus Lokiarchaeota archaeon]